MEDSERAPDEDRGSDRSEETLHERASEITSAMIVRGDRKHPLLLSTTPRAQHVDLSELGGKAAMTWPSSPSASPRCCCGRALDERQGRGARPFRGAVDDLRAIMRARKRGTVC